MQAENGYIKLYRKLKRWGWYKDTVVKCVFLHLILTASYTEFEWMGETFEPGQLITSISHLSEELGFSPKQIRTAIDKLCSTKEVGKRTTNKYTVITVMNWDSYQGEELSEGKHLGNPTANKGQTKGKQRATYKEYKEKKNKRSSNTACAGAHTRVPQLSEILSFISDNGLNVDGESFYKKYSENGWVTEKGEPITDWQKLLKIWDSRELKEKPVYQNGYAGVKSLWED